MIKKIIRKYIKKNIDTLTYNKTLEEMQAFRDIGLIYETEIWLNFWRRPRWFVPKFWEFDLKKVDTSNLTLNEYRKMEKQLRCIPPEILANSRHPSYYFRTSNKKCIKIMRDSTYIKKYAKGKGIYLSESELKEVYTLASELLNLSAAVERAGC